MHTWRINRDAYLCDSTFYVCIYIYMVKKNILNDNKNKSMTTIKIYIRSLVLFVIYVFCIRQDVKIPLKIVYIYEISLN